MSGPHFTCRISRPSLSPDKWSGSREPLLRLRQVGAASPRRLRVASAAGVAREVLHSGSITPPRTPERFPSPSSAARVALCPPGAPRWPPQPGWRRALRRAGRGGAPLAALARARHLVATFISFPLQLPGTRSRLGSRWGARRRVPGGRRRQPDRPGHAGPWAFPFLRGCWAVTASGRVAQHPPVPLRPREPTLVPTPARSGGGDRPRPCGEPRVRATSVLSSQDFFRLGSETRPDRPGPAQLPSALPPGPEGDPMALGAPRR